MPRKPMVTRTIETTTVTAICIDLAAEQPYEIVYILSGRYRNNGCVQKALENEINDDTHKVVHIKEVTVQSGLFGMTEQEFIKVAHPLPPRLKTKED